MFVFEKQHSVFRKISGKYIIITDMILEFLIWITDIIYYLLIIHA